MTWSELADRCELFVEERRQMIIALLKEAEIEMTRKVNIIENDVLHVCDGSTSYGIPSDYKQAKIVTYKSDIIPAISEDEFSYNTDGQVDTGSPTGYTIKNNGLHPNYLPADGKLRISYYATATTDSEKTLIPTNYHIDLCDYAIAVASAKDNPGNYQLYWTKWLSVLERLKNEDADRELIHHIKSEI